MIEKITNKFDKFFPVLERLAKLKKLFSSSITFWTVSRILMPFLISQLMAIQWGTRISEIIMTFISPNTPEWLKFLLELGAGYFEDGGDWIFIWIILFIVVLMVFVKLIEKEERTRYGFFYLLAFILFFSSIILYYLPETTSKINSMSNSIEIIKKDKNTEKYLITRIEKLEKQLLKVRLSPEYSDEIIEELNDQIIRLKLKLNALQIDEKIITKAQSIVEKGNKDSIFEALELIDKYDNEEQIKRLRKENEKQAKILKYKAQLYELVKDYDNAEKYYLQALQFNPIAKDEQGFAFFLQLKRAKYKEAIKHYKIALNKISNPLEKLNILNSLAMLYSININSQNEAETNYKKIIEIYKNLIKDYPSKYKIYLADAYLSLGKLYSNSGKQVLNAENFYIKALKIYFDLQKDKPKYIDYDIADVSEHLGILYERTYLYSKMHDEKYLDLSLHHYNIALNIRKEYFDKNITTYRDTNTSFSFYKVGYAHTLSSLANIYSREISTKDKAISNYKKSINIWREVIHKEDFINHKFALANVLNNFSILLIRDKKTVSEAKKFYKETLARRWELKEINPKQFSVIYAKTLLAGVMYFDKDIKLLNIVEEIFNKYPKEHDSVIGLQIIEEIKSKGLVNFMSQEGIN